MRQIELVANQSHDGFYFYSPSADYFFVTKFGKYLRKNPWVVALIEKSLKDDGCTWRGIYGKFQLKDMLRRGSIELKTCSHGDYYSITGDGWSCGDFKEKRVTKIYQM